MLSLLGEKNLEKGRLNSFGKISYAPQMPWVFNATLRENIIMGWNFCEEKYMKVLSVCKLNDVSKKRKN